MPLFSSFGVESVADFLHGFDVVGPRGVGFDFLAEGGDRAVNAAVSDEDLGTPDSVEDLIPSQGAMGMVEEVIQHAMFLGSEVDEMTFAVAYFTGGAVDGAGGELSDLIHHFAVPP